MKQTLTDELIAAEMRMTTAGRRAVTDSELRGLFVEIRRQSATFSLRACVDGAMRVIKLGNYPQMSTAEARAACIAMRRRIGAGEEQEIAQAEQDLPFATFMEEHYLPWYALYRKASAGIGSLYHNHFLPRFRKATVGSITQSHLLKMAQDMRAKGYAPGNINRAILVLRGALRRADEWGVSAVHPSLHKRMALLPDPLRHERFLSVAEVQRLQAVLDQRGNDPLSNALRFLLYTGARKREVLDAEWSHVDLPKARWRIPVTKNGEPRTVTLSDGAVAILRAARAYQYEELGDRSRSIIYVFANPATFRPYGCIFHSWKRIREAAGIGDVRIHDLRHSFASTLVNAGVSLYEVQSLLGHRRSTTTQRYAHLAPDRLKTTVAVIDRAYGSGNHARGTGT